MSKLKMNKMQKVKKQIRKANIDSEESSDEAGLHIENEQDTNLVRNKSERESALFQAYRALGYYTSSVPIVVYKSG